jgi:hypothetical protein
LIRWVLLLHEFDLEIRDKKDSKNVVANHLSKLLHEEEGSELPLGKQFPDKQLFVIHIHPPWYAEIVELHHFKGFSSKYVQSSKEDISVYISTIPLR